MTPTALQPGKMIPHFTLQAQDGSTVRVSDFRGRKNLVVIFPAGNNLSLVPALQDRESELIEENVAVLVIRADSEFPQRTHRDKPTQVRALCDPQNEVARRFGVDGEPVVYITDQYGEIYSTHHACDGAGLPDADDVLASLRHVNAACPE